MPQTLDATTVLPEYDPILSPEATAIRLNLGAGTNDDGTLRDIPGFIPIDRKLGTEVYPLAGYEDGTVDEIRASHVLEHFAQNEVQDILKHWTSKLKPGGILRIAVPDMARIFYAYTQNEEVPILSFIYGGQTDGNDFHKCGFDGTLLRNLLVECGLEDIRTWDSEINDCAKTLGPFSLNLMGRKPANAEIKQLSNVGGILAAPRLSYTMHVWCTQRAMSQLQGLECNIIQGCFWHQQLCEGMQKWVNAGKEYVLTLDYDTVFQPSDIIELYRLMHVYPEADAICALQSKRGGSEVLFSLQDQTSTRVATDSMANPVMQIATGHFGLTLFRTESLKTFPRPWMTALPGKDGLWDEGSGRVDADINFWHRWRDAGKKLYLANRVVVGHIEEKIKWPAAEREEPIYQSVQEYTEKGKPAGVWR